jgi:hypothetical protein
LFNTPVLFLIFKNPEVTSKVFSRIREIKPAILYISADGPRANRENEDAECEATRRLTENIDWECKVYRRYLPENLGCRAAVSSAISWMFETETHGIILEYDCLPDLSFFSFCETMLDKYVDDETVMHISGDNFQNGITRGDGSYYYSSITGIWGWATWRRAWKYFDADITKLPEFVKSGKIKNVLSKPHLQRYFLKKFESIFLKKNISTWGFGWSFAVMNNDGLCIVPNINLVSNIGFGEDATHANDSSSPFSNLNTGSMYSIQHPSKKLLCVEADNFYTESVYRLENTLSKKLSRAKNFLTSFVPKPMKVFIKKKIMKSVI